MNLSEEIEYLDEIVDIDNERVTRFDILVKYLDSAIENIKAGQNQNAISDIEIVLCKLNYNVRYIPQIEVPEENIIDVDSQSPTDPILIKINQDLMYILNRDHISSLKPELMSNFEEHVEDLKKDIKLTTLPIDEARKVFQQRFDKFEKERDDKVLEVMETLKNHPEYMEKVRENLPEHFFNTQENPE
jgi:hypothetical protein